MDPDSQLDVAVASHGASVQTLVAADGLDPPLEQIDLYVEDTKPVEPNYLQAQTSHTPKVTQTPVIFQSNGKTPLKLIPFGSGIGPNYNSHVSTMKATAAMKEQDTLNYMKRFTTSPYAANSVKAQRQHLVHLPPSSTPKFPSLHVLDATKPIKRTKARSIDDGLPDLTTSRPEYETRSKPKPFHSDKVNAWPLHPALIKHQTPPTDDDPPPPSSQANPSKRKDSRGRRKSRYVDESDGDLSEQELPPEIKEKKMRDRLTLVKEEILADEHLFRLADKASQPDEVVSALDALISIATGNVIIAQDSLFDRGGVAILLHILQKYSLDLDIQAKTCKLLDLMGRANPLTFKALFKQKGISAILGVVQALYSQGKPSKPKPIRNIAPKTEEKLEKATPSQPRPSPTVNGTVLFRSLVDNGFTSASIDTNLPPSPDNELLRKSCFVLQNAHYLLGMKHNRASSVEVLEHLVFKSLTDAKLMLTCQHTMMYLIDSVSGNLFAADYSPDLNRLEKALIRDKKFELKDAGIAGQCVTTKKICNITDEVGNNPDFNVEVDARGFNGKPLSLLSVPIINESGVVLGVLQAINKMNTKGDVTSFDSTDEFLFSHMATQLIHGMTTFNLHERFRILEEQYNLVIDSATSIRGASNVDELASRIIRDSKRLLNSDRSGLFLPDTETHDLISKIICNDSVQKIHLSVDKGIAGCTFRQGVIINVPNVLQDRRFNPEVDKQTGYNTRNILSAPLINTEGHIFGVLQILNKNEGSFNSEDERLAAYFAGQATVALDKKLLLKKRDEFAQIASDTYNYLQLVLHSVRNLIITIDDAGAIRAVNYPNQMELDPEIMQSIQSRPFKELFNVDANERLIKDIQKIIDSKELLESIQHHCPLKFGEHIRSIKYEIKQVSEVEIATGLNRRLIIVFLEDVTQFERAIISLKRYITPQLANRVMQEYGSELGGSKVKVATLLANIRQYTALSDTLEPEKLIPWMNDHLNITLKTLSEHEGLMDKLSSGSTSAMFGLLSQTPTDVYNACECAFKLQETMKVLNDTLAQYELPPVSLTVGINTGQIFAGFVGTPDRAEIVRVGETVSLAKYMESLTQVYFTEMIVTEFVQKEVNGDFHLRELDTIKFRVSHVLRTEPLKIYALYGRKAENRSEQMLEVLELYAKGLTLYRRRQFKTASEFFESALNVLQDDGPSKAMFIRCKQYIEQPPPVAEWDAAYNVSFLT
ncbi:hypothetical protein HDU79_006854 [Rhizoclosmatium sp. JEL0117]|nr:hypothetical protein HDU79_006854 [Rhizoclosmatium sp. JEL0117]